MSQPYEMKYTGFSKEKMCGFPHKSMFLLFANNRFLTVFVAGGCQGVELILADGTVAVVVQEVKNRLQIDTEEKNSMKLEYNVWKI